MARDIGLLHRLVKLIPPVGDFKNLVDLDMVLDELWSVARGNGFSERSCEYG